MRKMIELADLVGIAELADLFLQHKQTINNWTHEEGFPKPVIKLRMGCVYDAEAVISWYKAKKEAKQ